MYLRLIHTDVWQKPSQCCKVIILQLKQINKLKKKIKSFFLEFYLRHISFPIFCLDPRGGWRKTNAGVSKLLASSMEQAVVLAAGHPSPPGREEAPAPHPRRDRSPGRERSCSQGKLQVCSPCVHTCTDVTEVN